MQWLDTETQASADRPGRGLDLAAQTDGRAWGVVQTATGANAVWILERTIGTLSHL